MKNLFILTLTMVLGLSVGFSQGKVAFHEGTWQEAFAQAKKENKHVFVDAYTDWCHWCKVMDKETFTDPAIADYLNSEFIPIKMDMEKGFGIDVAMKFRVRAFPTTLYFNPDGEILHKVPGYEQDNSKFLDFLKEVRADDRDRVFAYNSQDFTQEHPEFMKGVFGAGGKRKKADVEEVNAWLENQEDYFTEEAWTVLSQAPTDEKYQEMVMAHADKYVAMYGGAEFDSYLISRMVYPKVREAGKTKDKALYDQAMAMMAEYMIDDEDKANYEENFELSYLRASEDWRAYTQAADAILQKEGVEDRLGFANQVAWTLYEKCEDQDCLKMMEAWMLKVIDEQPSFAFVDTYAALLYKTGDLPRAKEYAMQAIELGKKEESDISESENLLKKIEEGMK